MSGACFHIQIYVKSALKYDLIEGVKIEKSDPAIYLLNGATFTLLFRELSHESNIYLFQDINNIN